MWNDILDVIPYICVHVKKSVHVSVLYMIQETCDTNNLINVKCHFKCKYIIFETHV